MIPLEEHRQSNSNAEPERRDCSRYSVDEDAVVLFAGFGKLHAARIVSLSQEGCRVLAKERIAIRSGWPLEVSFKVNGVAFRLNGILRWATGGNLLGIRFVNVDPRRMVELAHVIAAMEADAAAHEDRENRIVAVQAGAAPTEQPALQAEPVAAQPVPRKDRRGTARHGVDTSASILLVNVGSTLRGRILDLSLGGCRIRTDERFPVGIYTRVETEFRLEGLAFRLGGVIQAIHDRNTVGIRFLDLSERKRAQVLELIGEIEESLPARDPVEVDSTAERV